MKKTALFLACLFAGTGAAAAQTWEAGLSGGYRTIKDATLKSVYGNGFVYAPYLSLAVSPSLRIGAEYEAGYAKDAKIGIFQDPSTLDVRGFHVFVQYGERIGRIQPYLKVGAGIFSYKLDIQTPTLSANRVDSTDISFFVGAGLHARLNRLLFLAAELKYVALWADPFDDQVDLGGLRALLGIGLVF